MWLLIEERENAYVAYFGERYPAQGRPVLAMHPVIPDIINELMTKDTGIRIRTCLGRGRRVRSRNSRNPTGIARRLLSPSRIYYIII